MVHDIIINDKIAALQSPQYAESLISVTQYYLTGNENIKILIRLHWKFVTSNSNYGMYLEVIIFVCVSYIGTEDLYPASDAYLLI